MSVLEDWLSQFEGQTKGTYQSAFQHFLDWAKTNPEELVRTYKEAPDKTEWAREWGNIVVRFQNEMLETGRKKDGKPYKKSGVRNMIVPIRSFFAIECQPLIIRKGRIFAIQMRTDGHIFSLSDLRKMFAIADTRDKAIISTSLSLGWGISDFLALKRKFVEDQIKRAKSENLDFISFDWQRGKTDAPILGILNPEAINWLEQWLRNSDETEYLWSSPRGERLKNDTIADLLNRLATEAGIVKTGTIHFHGFRKFLMSALTKSGLTEFETKLILGKTIPITDLTYLQGIKESAFTKFKMAYPSFSLIKTEANGKIEGLREALTAVEKENTVFKTRLEEMQRTVEKLDEKLSVYEEYRKTTQETLIKLEKLQIEQEGQQKRTVDALTQFTEDFIMKNASPEQKAELQKLLDQIKA